MNKNEIHQNMIQQMISKDTVSSENKILILDFDKLCVRVLIPQVITAQQKHQVRGLNGKKKTQRKAVTKETDQTNKNVLVDIN